MLDNSASNLAELLIDLSTIESWNNYLYYQ